MTPHDAARLMRQVVRAWYADGLPEIAHGNLLLGASAYLVWRESAPAAGALTILIRYSVPVLILGYTLGMRHLVFALKKVLTMGYRLPVLVGWGEVRRRRTLTMAGSVLAVAVIWGTARHARLGDAGGSLAGWLALFLALALGVAMLLLGDRLFLLRFHLLAAASGVLGAIAVGLMPDGSPVSPGAAYLGVMGAALITSGIMHLVLHVTRGQPLKHPAAQE